MPGEQIFVQCVQTYSTCCPASDRHRDGALDGVPCSGKTLGTGRLSYGRAHPGRKVGKGRLSFLQAGGDFGTPQPPQAGKVPAAGPAACRFWWNRLILPPAYGMSRLDGDLQVCIAPTPRTGLDQSGLSTMMVVYKSIHGPVPKRQSQGSEVRLSISVDARGSVARLYRRSKIRAMPAWAVALATLCGP